MPVYRQAIHFHPSPALGVLLTEYLGGDDEDTEACPMVLAVQRVDFHTKTLTDTAATCINCTAMGITIKVFVLVAFMFRRPRRRKKTGGSWCLGR